MISIKWPKCFADVMGLINEQCSIIMLDSASNRSKVVLVWASFTISNHTFSHFIVTGRKACVSQQIRSITRLRWWKNIKMTILLQFWIYMSFFFLLTGQNISEFEKVLRTIRDLWYSPDNNSNVGDIQYLHNYYKFIQRYVQCSLFNFMWNYFFSFLYGFIAGYLSGMNLIDSSVITIRTRNKFKSWINKTDYRGIFPPKIG